MCVECERIKERIKFQRELFEVVKGVSTKEYCRGFINGHKGLLDEDPSNSTK